MFEASVHTVYCEETNQIIPLEGRYCRACSQEVDEEDRRHTEVTPEVLRRAGHVTTPPREGEEVMPEA